MASRYNIGDLLLGPNRGNKNAEALGNMFATQLDNAQTMFTNTEPRSYSGNNFAYPPVLPDIAPGESSQVDYSSPEIAKAGVAPNVPAPVQSGGSATNDTQLAHELIQAVANPQSGVGSIKLPSGLEVTGVTPDKLQGTAVSGQQRIPSSSTPPVGKQEVTPPAVPVEQNNSSIFNDQRLGYVLGRAAQAVAGTAPNSFQYKLGGLGAELVQGSAYSQYLNDLETGKTPGGYANILSPEQKAAAENRVIAERKLALDETNAGVQRDLIKAQTAGTLTAEEKKNMEEQRLQASKDIAEERNLTSKEINDARIAAQMKLGEDKNHWMSMGKERNYAFNWKTGKIVKVAPTEGDGGGGVSSIGNLNSAMYSKFEEAATAEFLPQVFQKYKDIFAKKGWTTLVELRRAMTNQQTGAVDWELIMPDLSPEDRAKFGNRLAEYTAAHLKGIPYTVEFANIMNEKAQKQKTVKPDETGLVKPDYVSQEDWDAASPAEREEFLRNQGLLK